MRYNMQLSDYHEQLLSLQRELEATKDLHAIVAQLRS